MSDKYEWIGYAERSDVAFGYYVLPSYDNYGYYVYDTDPDNYTICSPPPWLLSGQLYQRGSDIDAGNNQCVYRFDGSLWTLVEDHSNSGIDGIDPWDMRDPKDQHDQRGTILDEAKTVINGERQDQYGSPEDSFTAIGDVWSWYLSGLAPGLHPVTITKKEVAVMMVLFKLARQMNQHKRDNLVDAAGYLGILGDMS